MMRKQFIFAGALAVFCAFNLYATSRIEKMPARDKASLQWAHEHKALAVTGLTVAVAIIDPVVLALQHMTADFTASLQARYLAFVQNLSTTELVVGGLFVAACSVGAFTQGYLQKRASLLQQQASAGS